MRAQGGSAECENVKVARIFFVAPSLVALRHLAVCVRALKLCWGVPKTHCEYVLKTHHNCSREARMCLQNEAIASRWRG